MREQQGSNRHDNKEDSVDNEQEIQRDQDSLLNRSEPTFHNRLLRSEEPRQHMLHKLNDAATVHEQDLPVPPHEDQRWQIT